MRSISSWRFRWVLAISTAWVAVSLSYLAWWQTHADTAALVRDAVRDAAQRGGDGVGAVSNGVPEFVLMFVIPPILLLMVVWVSTGIRQRRPRSLKRVLLAASVWPMCVMSVIVWRLYLSGVFTTLPAGRLPPAFIILAIAGLTIVSLGPAVLFVTVWYAATWHFQRHLPRPRY